MAEIPKEATVYVNPLVDWTQTQFVPPIYTELFCGYCETSIQTPDHELVERLYERHKCLPHPGLPSPADPVQWHESAARASANLLATTAIVLIVFLVLSAVNDWPMPWTN